MSANCTQNFVIKLDTCVRKKKIGPITIRGLRLCKTKSTFHRQFKKFLLTENKKKQLIFFQTIQILILKEKLNQTLLNFLNS